MTGRHDCWRSCRMVDRSPKTPRNAKSQAPSTGQSHRPSTHAETISKPSAAGGWGSVGALAGILTQEEVLLLGSEILLKQNKPDGYMCVSCSWAKPADTHPFEFCENGAKATAWEITTKRTTPEFFSSH